MNLMALYLKKRQNESAQEALFSATKTLDYQEEAIHQSFWEGSRLKEAALTYFYGKSEQAIFADSVMENQRNESSFSESTAVMHQSFSKQSERLAEAATVLAEEERKQEDEEVAYGQNELGSSAHPNGSN
jgi:hypothetical protein